MKPNLSVILPTYNEAGNIVHLVRKIIVYLASSSYEIIICDDNSPDNTAAIVRKSFINNKNVKIFVRKKDRGLANAIRYGIERSKGDWIIVMDTDFNHDPKVLPEMIKLKKSFDFIVGSRYLPGGGMENKLRFVLSFLYNQVIKLLLNLPTYDSLSGFYLIKREELEKLNFSKIFFGYGEYFIRLIFFSQKNQLKIKEIPVYYKNRTAGFSKSKFLSMLWGYSATVFNLSSQK